MIMTSNNVIVSIKLCLDVGNDGNFILCYVSGRGFEFREEETS